MRKGAMMSWRETRTLYWLAPMIGGLTILFGYNAYYEDDRFGFRAILGWSLVGLFVYGQTIYAALIYGYHHRDQIDPGDEAQMDFSKAYLGGVMAVILSPIFHLLISYFDG